ncbi:hypothetical protein ECE46_02655 [Helicobacter pylori]|nr:hypothetical protein ECE46_02655 [Helicobacter pylori]
MCLLFENYGAFKFCKIIACCLITHNSPKKRAVLELVLWVRWELEAREQTCSRFFNLTLSGRRNP